MALQPGIYSSSSRHVSMPSRWFQNLRVRFELSHRTSVMDSRILASELWEYEQTLT